MEQIKHSKGIHYKVEINNPSNNRLMRVICVINTTGKDNQDPWLVRIALALQARCVGFDFRTEH